MERAVDLPAVARRPLRGPKRLLVLRSDAALVDLVRAGDIAAFEALYERYAAGVLGFCRHTLGSREEAEDAAQQVFVAAHGAMRAGTRELAFKPWLYAIARNRCLSILRARRERAGAPVELSTAGLAEEVERRADLRELVADLQRLPERERAALLLTELGDLSHAETATVLTVDPHVVKRLVFNARQALIDRRDARGADCERVRERLATATGGTFRRRDLRYHLDDCPACADYLAKLRRQRALLGVALPVVPGSGLHDAVMSAAGLGVAGTGVAAATGVGASLLGGAQAAKVAIAAVLVGGAGITADAVRERGGDRTPAVVVEAPAGYRSAGPGAALGAAGPADHGGSAIAGGRDAPRGGRTRLGAAPWPPGTRGIERGARAPVVRGTPARGRPGSQAAPGRGDRRSSAPDARRRSERAAGAPPRLPAASPDRARRGATPPARSEAVAPSPGAAPQAPVERVAPEEPAPPTTPATTPAAPPRAH